MANAAQRQTMGHVMDELVRHRANVRYVQVRPMPTRHIATLAALMAALEGNGIEDDCSGTATLICRVAGLKDPSGAPAESGIGNTQTMYDHLPHYLNPADAWTGALCWFGVDNRLGTQHITVVRHAGHDPLLYSHGGHGAFQSHFVPLSVERRYHVGHPVFLSVAGL